MSNRGSGSRHVKTWASFDARDKLELVGIVLLACAAEVAVKLVSLPRLASMLAIALSDQPAPPSHRGGRVGVPDQATIDARAAAVDRVYRHWPRGGSCLRRSLVLGYRIRHARPTLVIGVANRKGETQAHAWIEVDGRVVGDAAGEWIPLRSHERAR